VGERKLSQKVVREANAIANSMCRMNATTAYGYGFCVSEDRESIAYGEFLYSDELENGVEHVLMFDSGLIRESKK